MLGNNIDETLIGLDYKALYMVAENFDKQATILRARAQKLQEREYMSDQVSKRVEYLSKIYKTVQRYNKQLHSAERACELTAEYTGVPLKTVKSRWNNFLNDKSHKVTKEKYAHALELHGLGASNVFIGFCLNWHPVHVSRVLKQEKAKRIYNPNPERIASFMEQRHKAANQLPERMRKRRA